MQSLLCSSTQGLQRPGHSCCAVHSLQLELVIGCFAKCELAPACTLTLHCKCCNSNATAQVTACSLATALEYVTSARSDFLQLQALQLAAAVAKLPQVLPAWVPNNKPVGATER